MSQKHVEWLLGRLLTDEDFRTEFIQAPGDTLARLQGQGCDLNAVEIEALLSGDPLIWRELSSRIPSRLKRCTLRH